MILDDWRKKNLNKVDLLTDPAFKLLLKTHSKVAQATFQFYESNGLLYIPVPGTTGSSSSPTEPGSDSSPVVIDVEGKKNLLVDSAQFHLEYACRAYERGCFYYGHSYRNEEPDNRHLAQFSHSEAEIIGTLEDVKELVEKYIRYITEIIWNSIGACFCDIPGIESRVKKLLYKKDRFKSLAFCEVEKILAGQEKAFVKCENGGHRLTPAGEIMLLKEVGEFIWIEKWDKMAVPFYQASDKETDIAYNADLLFGIGEVVGAGQRHLNAVDLEYALDEHRLNRSDYKWYIEMKRQYPLQTSGFGMGVERYLMWLLGVKDIRDIELFPRNRLQIGEI